jgi:hypothetical protein
VRAAGQQQRHRAEIGDGDGVIPRVVRCGRADQHERLVEHGLEGHAADRAGAVQQRHVHPPRHDRLAEDPAVVLVEVQQDVGVALARGGEQRKPEP